MDDVGEDWHEGVISLPLVTMLVEDILELSVVKDIKSLDCSIHEILTELSHIIQEETYIECVLPVPCHVLNGSNDQHDEQPDHDKYPKQLGSPLRELDIVSNFPDRLRYTCLFRSTLALVGAPAALFLLFLHL
jgi:hypothetical protein